MDKLGQLQKDPKYRRVAPKWIQIQWIRQTFPEFLLKIVETKLEIFTISLGVIWIKAIWIRALSTWAEDFRNSIWGFDRRGIIISAELRSKFQKIR